MITPIRRAGSPFAAGRLIDSALARASSSRTLARVSSTRTGLLSSGASAATTSRRTWVLAAPRIRSTTSSVRQPITSFISPDAPWPTPTMRSPGFSLPLRSAGPPGTISRTTTMSSCLNSTAPIPSSELEIVMLKLVALRGVM